MLESGPANKLFGVLHITVIQAQFHIDTELFGNMDPYVIIEHNKKKYQTTTKRDGGKHPVWNDTESFTLHLTSITDEIKLSAYDQDVIYDDFLGMNIFKAGYIAQFEKNPGWLHLFIKTMKSGEIEIQTKLLVP
jgi:Ca2+-dependent lipid-binding protein